MALSTLEKWQFLSKHSGEWVDIKNPTNGELNAYRKYHYKLRKKPIKDGGFIKLNP